MSKAILLPLLALLSLSASAGEFRALSMPGSQLAALSADGRSAAGGVIGGASGGFRWHEGTPPEWLAHAVSARAISASGRYVAGSSLDDEQREVATWWDEAGAPHRLGGLPGADGAAGLLSVGHGITDRPEVVGAGVNGTATVAFTWTAEEGMRVLDADAAASAALGISDDGRRIYGWSESTRVRRGMLWNDQRPCCDADVRGGDSEIVGANRDGTILVGIAGESSHAVAYIWSASAHAPIVGAGAAAKFVAADAAGSLLVGSAGSGAQRSALVWTPRRGVERLQDFLAARAIAVPAGWTLLAATAVSSDGHRLGGFGLRDGRFDSFIVDVTSVADRPSHPPTARSAAHPAGEMP
jgi:uncharacterized membrane protein